MEIEIEIEIETDRKTRTDADMNTDRHRQTHIQTDTKGHSVRLNERNTNCIYKSQSVHESRTGYVSRTV